LNSISTGPCHKLHQGKGGDCPEECQKTVPVSMLQEIDLPDVTDNFDDSHVTNTFCQASQ
jgi:hypothetical protein